MTNPILPSMDQFTNQAPSHTEAIKAMNALNNLIQQVKPGSLEPNLEGLLNNFQVAMQHANVQEIVAKHACFMGIQLLQEWFTGDPATDQQLEAVIQNALNYAEDPSLMSQPSTSTPPPLVQEPVAAVREEVQASTEEDEPETELDRALMALDDLLLLADEQKPNDPTYLEENPEMLKTLVAIIELSNKEMTTLEEVGLVIHELLAFVQDWLPEEDNDEDLTNAIITAGEYEVEPSINITGSVAEPETAQEKAEAEATEVVATTPVEEDSFKALQEGEESVKIPVFLEGDEDALPQIAVKTKALLQLIQKVERAIASKTVQDIERYIYFEFTEDRAIARAYNAHFMVETEIPAVVGEEPNYQLIGQSSIEICFLGSALIPMVKKLMSDDLLITYNVEKKQAVIESDSSEFVVFTEEGSQFPQPARLLGDVSSIMLPIDYLENMYQATIYAVSENNARLSLMGINHRITKEGIILTAADGYRLSRQTMDIELTEEVNEEINCTIPKESIAEILRLMNGTKEEMIELRLTEQRMEYVLPDVKIYGRLIEQAFPDISKMINEEMEFYMDVPHRVLKEALVFTSMFESDNGKKMVFYIKPSDDVNDSQLRIATPASEKGKYTQDAIVSGAGSEMTIQINFKYLADTLRKFQENAIIRIAYISHNAPLLLKDASAAKGNFDILLPIIANESGMHAKINKFKVKNNFRAFKMSMFDGLE